MADSNAYFPNAAGLFVPAGERYRELDGQSAGFLSVIRAMGENPSCINVEISTWDLYLAFSALQLTVTHPNIGGELARQMTGLGRQLQAVITAVHPEIEEMLEAGWHRELDHREVSDGG